jgi:lipid-A-disaccharide synthase
MVNLIAGKRVVPELIQSDFTAERVSMEVLQLLRDPSARATMRESMAEVRNRLGPPGAVDRAADAILDLVRDDQIRRTTGNAK